MKHESEGRARGVVQEAGAPRFTGFASFFPDQEVVHYETVERPRRKRGKKRGKCRRRKPSIKMPSPARGINRAVEGRMGQIQGVQGTKGGFKIQGDCAAFRAKFRCAWLFG